MAKRILASLETLGRTIKELQQHLEALRAAGGKKTTNTRKAGKKKTAPKTKRSATRSTKARRRG